MSQEYFYTKGQQRFGPVSAAELAELLHTGHLQRTDMVWRQGMPQWVPASALEEMLLGGSGVGRVIAKLSIPVAAILSLLGGTLSVIGAALPVGGLTLAGLIVAGVAVLPGLIALGVSLASYRNAVYLGTSFAAVFIALTASLLCVGSMIARGRINEAQATIAKAAEVEEKRQAAEAARRKAQEQRDRAEEALLEAKKQPSLNAKILDDIVQQRKELDAKRAADEANFKKRESDIAAREKETREKFDQIDKREQEAKDKAELADKKAKEAQERIDLADKKDKEAKDRFEQAEAKLAEARKHEAKAAEYFKGIQGEYKKLHELLKADRTTAVMKTLARLGAPPQIVKVDMSGIARDLCATAVKGGKAFKGEALSALKSIEPKLGELADALIYPKAKAISAVEYVSAVRRLPDFGHAGLPVIEAHLNLTFDWLSPTDVGDRERSRAVFSADVEALGKMAESKNEDVLKVLAAAPESELARRLFNQDYRRDVIAPAVRALMPK